MSERPIRVGIIGTGAAGRAHAAAYRSVPGVTLAACFDLNTERATAFAETFGFERVCSSVAELIEHVDAASVVTPDVAHAEPTLELLGADVHTLCEKPLTTTMADAHRVAEAARAATARGVMHLINFTKRTHPGVQEMIEIARSGALGEVLTAIGGYQQSWLAQDAWGHWSKEHWLWRLKKPGGSLIDLGPHTLDLLTAVVGPPTRMRCDVATMPKSLDGERVDSFEGEPLDADDIATQQIELANGGVALLQQSRWSTGHADRVWLEISGTEGAVRFDNEEAHGYLWTCLGTPAIHERRWEHRPVRASASQPARLIEAIRTAAPAQPDLIRGAEVQAMLDACHRSIASGGWEVPETVGLAPATTGSAP